MIWIVLGVVGLLAIALIAMYNSLVKLNVRVEEAWSDITVQLKRRYDLIPNLVKTVKGYASHEKGVFNEVTKARSQAINARGVKGTAEADNAFQQTLKSLFAVAEDYPDLKADANFKALQDELTDTEDKIQAARRFYNGSARDLNIKIKTFPTNLFASMLGFKVREFFNVADDQVDDIQNPVSTDF